VLDTPRTKGREGRRSFVPDKRRDEPLTGGDAVVHQFSSCIMLDSTNNALSVIWFKESKFLL
jgi:hypothetical protein